MAYSKSSVLSTATIVICLLNLLGWLLDIAFLKAPIPGTPAMSAPTAILLVLCAFSLLILYSRDGFKKTDILLARSLAVITAAVSMLLLARYIQGGQRVLANGLLPPSPPTLLFILFAGLYLFFISLESRKYFWVVNALQVMSFMVLWVVAFGYLLQVDRLYDYVQDGTIGMGIFTLISGFMLWLGITRLRPDLDVVMKVLRQRGAAGSITRQLFLISALAPLFMGSILHALNPGSLGSDLMFQMGIMLAIMGMLMCLLSTYIGMQLLRNERNNQDSLLQEILNASNLEDQLHRFKSLQAVPLEVCSWSRRIRVNDRWESFEDFLNEHFHIQISQSISEEEMEKVLDDFADKHKDSVGWSI